MPPISIPRTTKRVDTLLANKKINNESNDYHSYGRTLPGHPPVLLGQQFKFGKAEAARLSKSITTTYDAPTQKKVLKEIFARSNTINMSKGTIALTRDAAAELNKLSKQLGLDLKFTSGQQRPIHPVG
jgi:hypothetical protein